MAKLHSYNTLCPLIDQKSFLGVATDKDSDCVIVTLGRNVVHKYRVSILIFTNFNRLIWLSIEFSLFNIFVDIKVFFWGYVMICFEPKLEASLWTL